MRIASWEYTPGLWPTLATVLVLPLFISLGVWVWQLDRAEQKRILHHEFEARQAANMADLNKEDVLRSDFEQLHWRNVAIEGAFSEGINILLDNQVEGGVAGYFVYTPFKLKEQHEWVLVNRGWVPAGSSRDKPPKVGVTEAPLKIIGSVKLPPRTGKMLAENIIEQPLAGIYRTQKLVLIDAEELLNQKLLPYVVRMSPESPAGFVRHWKAPGSGEEKNLGYAFQWFSMATAILIIYLILNIKRVK